MRVLGAIQGDMAKAGTLLWPEVVSKEIWCRMSKNALPDSEASEVVGYVVGVAQAAEDYAVLRSGNVVGRRNVVRKSAVFVKVDDDQAVQQV